MSSPPGGSHPSVVHSPSCIRVVEGHTLRLTCQANGQPPGGGLLSGRRHTVTNSTLVIRHVTTATGRATSVHAVPNLFGVLFLLCFIGADQLIWQSRNSISSDNRGEFCGGWTIRVN